MIIDTEVKLTVCTKPLAKKLGFNYWKDKVIELITVNGKKNKTYEVVKEVSIKIANAMVSMNIYIANLKDETFLIKED